MAAKGKHQIGNSIIDRNSRVNYKLVKVIGTSETSDSTYLVYKAYCTPRIIPTSDFVAIKFLRADAKAENFSTHSNLVGNGSWFFDMSSLHIAALPYMSEGSLRYILLSRFLNGLPESFIAIALREALLGLQELHSSGLVHKSFSAGSIFINKSKPVDSLTIKLAFGASLYDSDLDYQDKDDESEGSSSFLPLTRVSSWAAAPEVYYSPILGMETVFSDMWLVGVTALELAYGVNLKATHREDFEAMVEKIRKSKRLPVNLFEEEHPTIEERPVPRTKVVEKIRVSKREKQPTTEEQPAPTTKVVEKKKGKMVEKQPTIENQPVPTTEVVEKKKGKMVERVQTPSIAAEGKSTNEEENPTAEETLAKVEKNKGKKVGRVTTIFKNNMKCCFTNEKENPTPEKAPAIKDVEMAERVMTPMAPADVESADEEENPEEPAGIVEKKKGTVAERVTTTEIESADEEENPEELPTNVEKKKRKMGEKVQTPRIAAEGKGANEEENPTAEETPAKFEKKKGEKVGGVMTNFKKTMKCCFTNDEERRFSRDFEKVVVRCLSSTPSKRYRANELLLMPFFRKAADVKYFEREVLHAKDNID